MPTIQVPVDKIIDLSQRSLERVGVPPEDAAMVIEILVLADLQGIDTHGTRRLGPYIERVRKNLIKNQPKITLDKKTPSVALLEGDNALGQLVGQRALQAAVEMAKDQGIAYVGCRHSNHFGAGAPYALLACRANMICMLGTNAFPTMAPWGGREVKVGNNPLAIGIPRRKSPHFILDMAMSVAARGKMRKASERGEAIPGDWALDSKGAPTTDPLEGLKGFVRPIGGHKGYGLALVVDVLAGVLTAGAFGTGVKSLFQNMDEPQDIGHFFIALDPSRFLNLESFFSRMDDFAGELKNTEPFDEASPVLMPGEIEEANLQHRTATGIPLDEKTYQLLEDLAGGRYGHSMAAY